MEQNNVSTSYSTPGSEVSLLSILRIPAVHQVLLLVGVAGAVAAGFAIVLWSQTPAFATLYGPLDSAESAEVSDALRAANIEFQVDERTGAIEVPESMLHKVRMQLAQQGLPGSAAGGMSHLQDQSSFGVTQFMENARYQHALESELASTIKSLGSVREARVHLAVPKQTSFVRDQKPTSASVLVHLHRGRLLESEQAAAIVNLVAASIPNLLPKDVTVVDQNGNLLSAGDESLGSEANSQFKYTRRLEESYISRIEDILSPVLGPGRVRAQVVADVDFTVTEETRESFDPERSVIRSEQISENIRNGSGREAIGVPGALSNQPPEETVEELEGFVGPTTAELQDSAKTSTRNYEVDRTISRIKPQAGRIVKLSVAVLIDEIPDVSASDDPEGTADQSLTSYTALIKEAVGFNEQRGDTVVVLREAFHQVADTEIVDAPPFWEKPVLRDAVKQLLGAIIVLAIAFGIVRPMLRGVLSSGGPVPLSGEYLGSSANLATAAGVGRLPGRADAAGMVSFDEKVAAAKNITGSDPARVAHLVRKWVASND